MSSAQMVFTQTVFPAFSNPRSPSDGAVRQGGEKMKTGGCFVLSVSPALFEGDRGIPQKKVGVLPREAESKGDVECGKDGTDSRKKETERGLHENLPC